MLVFQLLIFEKDHEGPSHGGVTTVTISTSLSDGEPHVRLSSSKGPERRKICSGQMWNGYLSTLKSYGDILRPCSTGILPCYSDGTPGHHVGW